MTYKTTPAAELGLIDDLPAREAYDIIDSDAEHLRRENEILRKGLSVSREMEHAALKRVEAMEAEHDQYVSDREAWAAKKRGWKLREDALKAEIEALRSERDVFLKALDDLSEVAKASEAALDRDDYARRKEGVQLIILALLGHAEVRAGEALRSDATPLAKRAAVLEADE